MRGGSSPSCLGPASLHSHDRDSPRQHAGHANERPRVRDGLEVKQDEVGCGVLVPVHEQVVAGDIDTVAHRYEPAYAKPAALGTLKHGEAYGAGLAQQLDPPLCWDRPAEGGVEAPIASAREYPCAVGANEPHAVGERLLNKSCLQVRPARAGLGEAGRDDANCLDPERARLGDDRWCGRGRHADDDQVRDDRARGQVRIRGDTLHDRVLLVYR